MALTTPFWFNMRQGKAEPAGDNIYKLTAPNLPESFITVRSAGNGWTAAVRAAPDAPDMVASNETYDKLMDAWYAAFELFRNQVVV
jgi:hypothetical protein